MSTERAPQLYDRETNMTIHQRIDMVEKDIQETQKKLGGSTIDLGLKRKEILAQIEARRLELARPQTEKPTEIKKGAKKNSRLVTKSKQSRAHNRGVQPTPEIGDDAVEETLETVDPVVVNEPIEFKFLDDTSSETELKPLIFDTQEPEAQKEAFGDVETFANTAKEELREVIAQVRKEPSFAVLSEGQQLLVLQGVTDRLYDHVHKKASETFEANQKQKGFMGRMWGNARKSYLIAPLKREALYAATYDTDSSFVKEILPDLIHVFKETGLRGSLSHDAEGKPFVVTHYSEVEGSLVSNLEYDKAASALARIPDEWNKPGATRAEQKKYREAEAAYRAEKETFMQKLVVEGQKMRNSKPELDAAEAVSLSETLVSVMRLFSAHPEAMKRIESISKNPAWLEGIKDTLFERTVGTVGGIASASGRITRGAVTFSAGVGSVAALVAAPFVAMVVGGIRSNERAKQSLRERDKLARRGVTQEGPTAYRMSNVDRKLSQLVETQKIISSTSSDTVRQEAIERLRVYVDFIETKLELGQVNFGGESRRGIRQYELMRKLHMARTTIVTYGSEFGVYEALRNRVTKFGEFSQKNTERARKNEILDVTTNGMLFGIAAGSIGLVGRYFYEHFNFFHPAQSVGSAPLPKADTIVQSPTIPESTSTPDSVSVQNESTPVPVTPDNVAVLEKTTPSVRQPDTLEKIPVENLKSLKETVASPQTLTPRVTPESLGLRAPTEIEDENFGNTIEHYDKNFGNTIEHYDKNFGNEIEQYNKEINADLKDIDPSHTEYQDTRDYSHEDQISQKQFDRAQIKATRMARHQVNRFFSYRDPYGRQIDGQHSLAWQSYSKKPMDSLLRQNIKDFKPSFRPFIRHMRALAEKYPEIRRDRPLGEFMAAAYLYKAEDGIAGTHIAGN